MVKKSFAALFFMLLCFSFLFAQNTKKSNEINWELLEVSGQKYSNNFGITKYYRTFNYLTSGISFIAQDSLEWMKDSNWELVSVYGYEGGSSLFFKRIYDKQRTEKEIERLKKDFEKGSPAVANTGVIDLDLVEDDQKARELALSEKIKYANLLKQINGLPLKIVSLETTSDNPKVSKVAIELVLDATALLVKDGKSYRSSEAEKYFQETVRQILDKLNAQSNSSSTTGNSRIFSSGNLKPEKIGGFKNFYGDVNLKISVIVDLNGQQNIVSQGFVYSNLKKDK